MRPYAATDMPRKTTLMCSECNMPRRPTLCFRQTMVISKQQRQQHELFQQKEALASRQRNARVSVRLASALRRVHARSAVVNASPSTTVRRQRKAPKTRALLLPPTLQGASSPLPPADVHGSAEVQHISASTTGALASQLPPRIGVFARMLTAVRHRPAWVKRAGLGKKKGQGSSGATTPVTAAPIVLPSAARPSPELMAPPYIPRGALLL